MYSEFEQVIFDGLRSKMREKRGVEQPICDERKFERSRFCFHDYYWPGTFSLACRFLVEYLTSISKENEEANGAEFVQEIGGDVLPKNSVLAKQPSRAKRLIDQLCQLDEIGYSDGHGNTEFFSLILDQIANGIPSVQAAALEVVCPRVIPTSWALLRSLEQEILPAVSKALRSEESFVLERAVFAWETFCVNRQKNFGLDDYFRVLEIWERTSSMELDLIAGCAIAIVPQSIIEFSGSVYEGHLPPIDAGTKTRIWAQTIQVMNRMLSNDTYRDFCCCMRFLSVFDSVLSCASIEASPNVDDVATGLVKRAKIIHGNDVSAQSLLFLSRFAETNDKQLAYFGSTALRQFIQPYESSYGYFRSLYCKFEIEN